jgi:glycosyltransferase involved in cell wall biosynthesis
MKFVFISNYFNHHQKPFCEEMYHRLGSDFAFIATSMMSEERRKLGYADDAPPYVRFSFAGRKGRAECVELIRNADVVLAGSAPDNLLTERIQSGKLLLRYSERPFKIKPSLLKRLYHGIKLRERDLWKKNIYMLCASAYTVRDYASIGMYRKRTYKWGYFPVVKEYDTDALMTQKKANTLMWCGRFIDWKHPDDAIRVAQKLKASGYDFHLNMVGTGTMEQELHTMAEAMGVADCVRFTGSMPTEQVRLHMEEAGIYLFTSDRQEGWGAVLNEAMNSGCSVVASHAAGSAPYLIHDGENGLLYTSGNVDEMYEKVKRLLDSPEDQRRIGSAAYTTMRDTWNAEIAVDRILLLTERILAGEKHPNLFEKGPCSLASVKSRSM